MGHLRTTKTTHDAWHVRLAEDDPWLARKTPRWSARCTPCWSEKPNNGGSHWWDQAKSKRNGIEELPGHDLDISGYYFTIFHNISSRKWLCSLLSHGNIGPVPSPFFTPKKPQGFWVKSTGVGWKVPHIVAHIVAHIVGYIPSGWWFGTWILFFHILEIIIPTDFHIFQRGWKHQPAMNSPCLRLINLNPPALGPCGALWGPAFIPFVAARVPEALRVAIRAWCTKRNRSRAMWWQPAHLWVFNVVTRNHVSSVFFFYNPRTGNAYKSVYNGMIEGFWTLLMFLKDFIGA